MDWDKLRVFYNVAESGSFTKAAQRLEVSQSAVSRQVSNLEDTLETPLFHRHARGLILTEQGELLFKTTREVFSELTMVEAQIKEENDETFGALKLTAPIGFGNMWIAPRLPEFLKRYPDLQLTFVVRDYPIELSLHQGDAFITTEKCESDEFICKELITDKMKIYSSREYLLRFNVPLNIQQLVHHRLLGVGEDYTSLSVDPNWLLNQGVPKGKSHKPYITINSLYGLGRALESGSGIALLPEYLSEKCTDLVQILPEIQTPDVTLYYAFSSQLSHSKRIKALHDFLMEKVEEYYAEKKQM